MPIWLLFCFPTLPLCHKIHTLINTVKSQFLEPPRETKTGLKNQIVQEIGGKIKLQSVAY